MAGRRFLGRRPRWVWRCSAWTPTRARSSWRSRGVDDFTNPAGNVLGAFLAAMLYDTVGPTVLATVGPDEFQATKQLTVNFLRPARPGRVVGRGRIVRRDGDLRQVEASLIDERDELLATATAVVQVIPLSEAREAV